MASPARHWAFAFGVCTTLAVWLASGCGLSTEGTGGNGAATTSTAGHGGSGAQAGTGPGANGGTGGGQAGTAGTGAEAGTGGSGGGPVEQNCLDGLDDEGDGLTDCDDPDCGAFTCLPGAAGAVARVAALAQADCPAPATMATSKSCDACSCGAGSAGSCWIHVDMYASSGCNTPSFPYNDPGCHDPPDTDRWFLTTIGSNADGWCWPDNQQVAAQSADRCALSQAGSCANGGACVPHAIAAATATCVELDGVADCPAPYDVERHLTYEGAADQCGCVCVEGTQSCQAGPLVVSSDRNDCGGTTSTLPTDGNCQGPAHTHSLDVPDVTSTLQCDPLGVPTGSFVYHTLCCMPGTP
jgi:hypothetical protein